jgi:hypothetical protein
VNHVVLDIWSNNWPYITSRGPDGSSKSYITSLSPIRRGFTPSFVNYKKGALDLQPQVIKFTSSLPRVGGSLRVLRLPPPLKLVTISDIPNIQIQKFMYRIWNIYKNNSLYMSLPHVSHSWLRHASFCFFFKITLICPLQSTLQN